MAIADYEAIIAALETAGVRYVIAGGFAVNLHGFLRFTKDLDLLIDLAPDNAARAMEVLAECGLKSRVPVDVAEFADPHKRNDWFENRNMLVFQLWHPRDAFCTVDIFMRNPVDFEELWQRAETADLGRTACRIASIDHLIVMKTQAGRPQDFRDIEELQRILRLKQQGKA
ncbi:MAG: nucleotidyl transferase AbiEii/AbiGii toxin family protein [Lysobacterales bacterium]